VKHHAITSIAALALLCAPPGCAEDDPPGGDDDTSAADADGDGFTEAEGDCDDTDPDVNYLAIEVCDGVDNDCDLQIDEPYDLDFDGATTCGADGLPDTGDEDCDDGNFSLNLLDEDGDGVSTCGGDCDDTSPTIHPGAIEACNGLDDNCDGAVPADDVDVDADGWLVCAGDCDDGDWSVRPGAPEVCNGVDDDCDAATDETADGDGDGFSVCDGDCDDTDPGLDAMDADGDGASTCDGDCDDTDLFLGPQAAELCDSVDNDCDGAIDEGCVTCSMRVPGDQPTLADAFSAAQDGEVICVEPGTYNECVDFLGVDAHLLAVAGPAVTTIDGSGQGSTVSIHRWEGPDTILEGFTITGGYDRISGGGVRVEFCDPTLSRLVVTGNAAGVVGGGILLNNSMATLVDIQVLDNELTGGDGGPINMDENMVEPGGGGIFAWRSGASLSRVTIVGNSAFGENGGGLRAAESSIVLEDIRVEDNEALTGAGAHFLLCSEILIDGASFTDNLAGDPVDHGAGGGLFVDGSVVRASHLVVAGNRSGNNGAGFDVRDESLLELTHAVIVGNQTGYNGGGLAINDADVVLESSVVAANTAAHHGGGLDVYWPERLQMVNTVVVANLAAVHGGGLSLDNYQNASFTHCDVWGNTPTDIDTQSNPAGADGNIEAPPEFLQAVTDDVFDLDLHLATWSSLVDAGDPTRTDPDGSPSDIGAFGGPYGSWP